MQEHITIGAGEAGNDCFVHEAGLVWRAQVDRDQAPGERLPGSIAQLQGTHLYCRVRSDNDEVRSAISSSNLVLDSALQAEILGLDAVCLRGEFIRIGYLSRCSAKRCNKGDDHGSRGSQAGSGRHRRCNLHLR